VHKPAASKQHAQLGLLGHVVLPLEEALQQTWHGSW
jgi:hypothetical protein